MVNKLFEFMHETHPGVQDMACDTFLKISNKCKRKFVVLQLQEQQPFLQELLDGLELTIQDLQPHQIHSFYESVGLMIGAEGTGLQAMLRCLHAVVAGLQFCCPGLAGAWVCYQVRQPFDACMTTSAVRGSKALHSDHCGQPFRVVVVVVVVAVVVVAGLVNRLVYVGFCFMNSSGKVTGRE